MEGIKIPNKTRRAIGTTLFIAGIILLALMLINLAKAAIENVTGFLGFGATATTIVLSLLLIWLGSMLSRK